MSRPAPPQIQPVGSKHLHASRRSSAPRGPRSRSRTQRARRGVSGPHSGAGSRADGIR